MSVKYDQNKFQTRARLLTKREWTGNDTVSDWSGEQDIREASEWGLEDPKQ